MRPYRAVTRPHTPATEKSGRRLMPPWLSGGHSRSVSLAYSRHNRFFGRAGATRRATAGRRWDGSRDEAVCRPSVARRPKPKEKFHPMRKATSIAAALVATGVILAALASPVAASAGHAKTVAFKGTYSGKASLLINNSSIRIKSVSGSGSASLIGKGTLSGSGSATAGSSACIPWKGTGTLKGASGSITVQTNVASTPKTCSSGTSGKVTVTVKGTAKVTGGTGAA